MAGAEGQYEEHPYPPGTPEEAEGEEGRERDAGDERVAAPRDRVGDMPPVELPDRMPSYGLITRLGEPPTPSAQAFIDVLREAAGVAPDALGE